MEHEDEQDPAERPAEMLAALEERDLSAAEAAFSEWENPQDEDFTEIVTEVTGDYCTSCDHCSDTVWSIETIYTKDDETVCESCTERFYSRCDACSIYVHDNYVRTWNGERYCPECFDEAFCYCEHCDDYQPVDDHDFDHEEDQCDCVACHESFTFPADGHGTISEDERLNVTLPAGTIDEEGIRKITRLVVDNVRGCNADPWYLVPCVMEEIGAQWQTKRGNFTRRLSSTLYRLSGGAKVKLPDGVISEIGNIARAHSSTGSSWDVEVTRDLNLPAEDFYHESSCWWGSYGYSRCALKSWGGLALRTFTTTEDTYWLRLDGQEGPGRPIVNVSGRAWVQPVRMVDGALIPTHETIGVDGYVVYNGYGNLDGYTGTRIVAHLTSMTYKKVALNIDRQYVNGNTGYLVASEDICQAVERITWDMDEHDLGDARHVNRFSTGVFA